MLPIHSDPDVLERIYRHFSYLGGAPVTLRGFDDHLCLSSATLGDWLLLLLADPDTTTPYTLNHVGLSDEENALLTHQQDLTPVVVWPQPIVGVLWNADFGQGVTTDIQRTDVILRRTGSVQLRWGSGVGVIFEAFLDQLILDAKTPTVLDIVWDASEAHLREQGVQTVWTSARDPMFEDAFYRRYLAGRGYQAVGRGIAWRKLL